MKTLCASHPRLISAVVLAVCAGAVPAGAEIIVNSYSVFHQYWNEVGGGYSQHWHTGGEHLGYGERWTPAPGLQDPQWTYTQTRAQDRVTQDPATGAITATLMTSAYWQTTEPEGCSVYLIAGAYLSINVTITTPGDYGMLWLVAGPGWPNSQASIANGGLSEVAWELLNSDYTFSYFGLDIGPPAAPLTGGHMTAHLEPGTYIIRSTNVLWPTPILPGPGARHVDQVVWFEFGAPAPGPAMLAAIAIGALAAGRRR